VTPELTQAQKTAIKNFINADPVLSGFVGQGQLQPIADALNQFPALDFLVWGTAVSVQAVHDAIDYSKYTPVDPADLTIIYTNRMLLIQTKQMNLNNMLVGRDWLDASKTQNRASLRDAVIQLPAGAAGALVSAGGASGVNVMTALTRKATVVEKLLVTSNPMTGGVTAGVMGSEGPISAGEVDSALIGG
jgi:hypothetical protein